ncbi:hypothetical protein Tco_0377910, partial [Tanacetum coccineum]
MDNLNLTMEEYIKLEEEKAHKRGKVFNWQTATYGKIKVDDGFYDLRSMEAEFLAIEEQNVLYFNDLFPFNIIRPDDLKSEKDKDDNDIDITQSLLDNEITHGSTMLFETSHDMALPPREQRHRFLRTKPGSKFSNVVHGYDTEPSRILTQKERMEIREIIPSEKEAEEKSNLKTSL